MENNVIITKDGKQTCHELPQFGTIEIIIVDGKPERIETTNKEKL